MVLVVWLLSSSNYNLFSKIKAFGDFSESLFTLRNNSKMFCGSNLVLKNLFIRKLYQKADKKGEIGIMDNGNWGGQYPMENIIDCEYNMDSGYVEAYYYDGNILRLKCEEIEASLRTTEQSLAKLHKLLIASRLSMLQWCCREDYKLIVT